MRALPAFLFLSAGMKIRSGSLSELEQPLQAIGQRAQRARICQSRARKRNGYEKAQKTQGNEMKCKHFCDFCASLWLFLFGSLDFDVALRARASFDLGAMQDPARIVVEGITPVHGRPVVPHYEIADLPNPAPDRCVVGGISPQPVEYRLRLRKRQSLDVSVATTAQVQNPAPGFRMSADKRMIYTRRMPRVIDGGCTLPDISAAVVRGVMFETEIRNFLFELVRQAFVGTIHIAEIGVAAFRGNFQRINHTGFRRIIEVRHIRMPTRFAGAQTADGLSIFDHVRNDVNFRMTFNKSAAALLNGRMVQFAEAATEGNQIFIVQLLLTKQQDLMVEPGSVNGFELIGPNLSDIYAANLGAERLSSWDDFHGGIFYQPQRGTKITKRSARFST